MVFIDFIYIAIFLGGRDFTSIKEKVMSDVSNEVKFDLIRAMMKTYSIHYIVIHTKFTTHHLEKLMPTCKDRGAWKWIGETKHEAFDEMGRGGEAGLSHIDRGDMFPRLYFLTDSFINEFREWLKCRELEITEIEAPKI